MDTFLQPILITPHGAPLGKAIDLQEHPLKVESNHPVISIVKGDAAGISVYARLAGLIFLVLLDLYLGIYLCN